MYLVLNNQLRLISPKTQPNNKLYILKSMYLGGKLLFMQVFWKVIEHCLISLILFF